MRTWYYEKGGEKQGPISEDELVHLLETDGLNADTLVWTEDLTEWTAARNIENLVPEKPPEAIKSKFKITGVSHPSVASGGTKTCPSCGAAAKSDAVLCTMCGRNFLSGQKLQSGAVPVSGKNNYYNYNEVPWSRRAESHNVFALLCFIFWVLFPCIPALFYSGDFPFQLVGMPLAFLAMIFPSIIVITGNVYTKKTNTDGTLKKWNWILRFCTVVICVLMLLGTIHNWSKFFVGVRKDMMKNGQGTMTLSDGKVYVGEWKDYKPNGQGTMTFPNGTKYVGEWKDGMRNGQGKTTLPDGEEYVGEWKDGTMHGQGTIIFSDGQKYVGEWKDGMRNGQGTTTLPNGMGYVGEWKEGKMHGHGTLTLSDGTKHGGEFKHGMANGQGIRTLPDGTKCAGEWKDDKLNGQVTVTSPDGTTEVGQFKDGELVPQ